MILLFFEVNELLRSNRVKTVIKWSLLLKLSLTENKGSSDQPPVHDSSIAQLLLPLREWLSQCDIQTQ